MVLGSTHRERERRGEGGGDRETDRQTESERTHTHKHTHTHRGGEAHSPSLIERVLFWGTLPHLGRQGVRGSERPLPPYLHTGAKRHIYAHTVV